MYKRKGFSLVEAMIATSIVTIAAGGVLLPFTTGMSMQQEGKKHTLAAKLASDKMEEIIANPFDQIVSTYNGYSDGKDDDYSESYGDMENWSDSKLVGDIYSNFSREVECHYVYVDQQAGQESPIFILATVKVYYSQREIANITMLIGEYDESSAIDFL